MKKIVCMLAFLAGISFSVNAQSTDTTMETYCEVIGRAALSLTGKIKIEVDFGQENKMFEGFNNDMLKDPVTGKPMKFNSMIDALNHMASKGWLFVNAYQITENSNTEY